jgi:hypothetical protein
VVRPAVIASITSNNARNPSQIKGCMKLPLSDMC